MSKTFFFSVFYSNIFGMLHKRVNMETTFIFTFVVTRFDVEERTRQLLDSIREHSNRLETREQL